MAFEPDKITPQHVLDAVKKIKADDIKLRMSTGYDVVIEGERYPPKEIMRHAHKQMNGEYLWYPGGGEETNKYLRKLGFKITSKRTESDSAQLTGRLYKLGCNWGKNAPSFFSFIKERKIVVGVEDKRYKVGDLVLVTEGFRTRALCRVVSEPGVVTANPGFQEPFSALEIDYQDYVNYADVEWYDIPVQAQFDYKLQSGIRLVRKKEIKDKVFDLWTDRKPNTNNKKPVFMKCSNTIIYGPPGTGKTYSTKAYTCSLVEDGTLNHVDEWLQEDNREECDRYWKELKKNGQVEFVTFHQSFAYEDFVQGIRPVVHTDQLGFKKTDGIFKTISDRARENYEINTGADEARLLPFDTVFEIFIEDLLMDEPKEIEVPMFSEGYSFTLTDYDSEMGRIKFRKRSGGTGHDLLVYNLRKLYDGRVDLSSHGLRSYYYPFVSALKKQAEYIQMNPPESLRHYVLVIDEINRANISRVLGELITLLEPDKRLGQMDELEVKLPSGEPFGVPPNLHIVGTMNTADKSIAHLDVALRRRFDFRAIYPDVEKASEPHRPVMRALNEAILQKHPADFLIGHSYFMNNRPLDVIMNEQVIPLLNEYFDYEADEVEAILEQSGLQIERKEFGQVFCLGLKETDKTGDVS